MVAPYADRCFYISNTIFSHHPYYAEVVKECFMSCCYLMVMDGSWGLKMFLETFTKRKATVILYSKGICECLKNISNRHGIQTHFRDGSTLKNMSVAPKDEEPIIQKNGVIYRFKSNRVNCDLIT